MTPAEHYAARQHAFAQQHARRRGQESRDRWAGGLAERAALPTTIRVWEITAYVETAGDRRALDRRRTPSALCERLL